jgi:hypothetical protein
MPGGLAFDSTQSYVVFSGIKLVGYSLYALYLNSKYTSPNPNFLLVGVSRTLLGMLFGAVVGIIGFWALNMAVVFFLLALIPFRILEWSITMRAFYYNENYKREDFWKNIISGIICSFILDIPAILGFVATGGFWIC